MDAANRKKELRRYGIQLSIALALLGGLFWWKSYNIYVYFFIISPAFLLTGLLRPSLLAPIYTVWMAIAKLLGTLMTKIILILLFYLLITPIGLLLRLFGKDFLTLRFDKKENSYWIKKQPDSQEKSQYDRQY